MSPARPPWTPDVELSQAGAAQLISSQFPSLSSLPLEKIGSGWDNDAYRVGATWLFRFPRRRLGVTCIENESRWLPRLAQVLPLPVPEPRWFGQPSSSYPFPFLGSRWVEGETACSVDLSPADLREIALPLARFLSTLHAQPLPPDAPRDPAGWKDVPTLIERIGRALERVEDPEAEAAREAAAKLAGASAWSGERAWVHGDLYARHLLVDRRERGRRSGRRRLAGVIDWGDVHAGEIADDLSIAWSFLDGEAREAFFGEYGEVERGVRERARLYALHIGAVIAGYGREVGDGALREAGRRALKFASA